jgi:PKD domain
MKEKSTSSFRLDEQVYLTMILVAVISLLVLGFRYTNRHPCPPVTLQIQSNSDSLQKGNLISFKANAPGGNDFSWNFGDGSKNDETTASVFHKFIAAGTYTISVTVDDQCTEFQDVVITEGRISDYNTLGSLFNGPSTGYLGFPVTFEDLSTKSTSWEWYFDDHIKVDATGKSATYIFKTPGVKKISLIVDGRRDLMQFRFVNIIDREAEKNLARAKEVKNTAKPAGHDKIVFVQNSPTALPLPIPNQQIPVPADNKPKKEEEKPKAPARAPDVTGAQMEALLKEVVAGTKTAQDFLAYFCGDLSKMVVYNSNSITFISMCNTLKGLKIKKVKSIKVVQLFKDAATNCQQSMIVTVEVKKGIFPF